MAKFTSHIYSEIRGSVSGTVYSRNRYGAYTRRRVAPAQPRTTPQTTIRAQLATLSQKWRALTEAQRNSWKAFAEQVTAFDSLGQAIRLTGLQAYIKYNIQRFTLALPRIDTPPSMLPSPAPLPTDMVLQVDTATNEVKLDWAQTFSGALVVEATSLKSPGISFVGPSAFRIIATARPGAFGATLTAPVEFGPQYVASFGGLLSGRKLFVSVRPIDYSGADRAGWSGQPKQFSLIVP